MEGRLGSILQIGVLANDVSDDGQALGPGTITRCECALVLIRKWLRQRSGARFSPSVVIYIAAGKGGRWRGEKTLASAIEEYLKAELGNWASFCMFVTNCEEEKVWSTLGEMRWIFHEIGEMSSWTYYQHVTFELVQFVTNSRHAKRVRFIKWFSFKRSRMGPVLISQEAPPPLWHEFCAYIKIGLVSLGLGQVVEHLRRRWYRG